jgi:hypothetical protein
MEQPERGSEEDSTARAHYQGELLKHTRSDALNTLVSEIT